MAVGHQPGRPPWPSHARLVVPLDGFGHRVGLVGGKAASLDALVRRGFRVPPAVAATTTAYRAFISANPALDAFLADLVAAPVPGPAQSDAQRADIESRFLDAALPPEITEALSPHLADLSPAGERLAVRSSATSEDLAVTSFAGQHLSVLEIDGAQAVFDALRRVWSSLWFPAPRSYRDRMDVRDEDLAMAVIVQRMVPAVRSGVCFTIDPTRSETLRLEVVDGLGEALVSGRETPEVHQLALPSLRPVDGRPVDHDLRQVARASLRIEEELGGQPQDVEWSVTGDEVWILQARPITTSTGHAPSHDGFDTPNRAGDLYAPGGVAEMLPGVLPPLLWTINGPLVEEGFRRLFDRLGVLPTDLDHQPYALLGRFSGQIALDLTRVKDAARRMAGGTGAEVERQYLGEVLTEPGDEPGGGRLQQIRNLGATGRALRLRRSAEREALQFERSVSEVLSHRPDLFDLRSSELLAYRARVRDLAAYGVAAEIGVAVAAVASYRALEVALERWTGDKASRWAQRLTRDASGGSQGACGCAAAIWGVFQDVAGREVLEEAITASTPQDAEASLMAAGPVGRALVERLWQALENLGSAAVYAGPTWDEQPDYVWQTLLGCLQARIGRGPRDPLHEARQGAAEALARLEAELTGSTKWKVTRVLTGQIVDVRIRTLRNLVANARALLSRRESVKAAVLALGGEERRAIRILADRLARRGALRSAADIELLADWELDALVADGASLSRDELDRRTAAVAAMRQAPPLDRLLDHRGSPAMAVAETEGVTGWGGSPGVHTGRVRVVREAAEAEALQPGDVLVAVTTDPSWTPLFLIAGAVVVERGGPLSHAAIVARELGVPAVLNAVGATRKLVDGDVVRVDGDAGVVTVQDPETSVPVPVERQSDPVQESA